MFCGKISGKIGKGVELLGGQGGRLLTHLFGNLRNEKRVSTTGWLKVHKIVTPLM